jgi:DNA ligase (NAD+)
MLSGVRKITIKKRKRKLKIKSKNKTLKKMKKMEKKIEENFEKSENVEKSKQIKEMNSKQNILNEELINLLDRLEKLMMMKKEPFRARAYQKASETMMLLDEDITDISQLKGKSGIGKTMMDKFKEYLDTGTLKILEDAKTNPIFTLVGVHGIGYKNAKKLVEEHGITTIAELRKSQDLLNNIQKKGLKHYEDVLKRIPRPEIVKYEEKLTKIFNTLENKKNSTFKIVGSYLRGAQTSGDIDIIITNSENNVKIFKEFIDELEKKGILIDILSKGAKKSMAVGKIGKTPARRIDFMYSSPEEFPFATLYFTGSKAFNVVMRQRAVDLGYTMNEHGLYKLVKVAEKKKLQKGEKVDSLFPTEQSIFQHLGMVYKSPTERKNGRAVKLIVEEKSPKKNVVIKKQRTLKIKKKSKHLTKERLLEFGKKGINVLKKLDEEALSKMIICANDAYYNKKSLIDDNTYDILKEYIERVYPENTTIQLVGAPISKDKVVLPYQMWSQNKIKPDTKALHNWMKKYKGPYVISGKLDGISALYVQDETGEQKLYTRGEATKGMDISYLIPYLQLPDVKEGETRAVRGELIIKRETFKNKYEGDSPGKYKNPRNFVAGIVNAKKRAPKKWHDMDFVAYEVIEPQLKPSKQMDWLKKHNIIEVLNMKTKKISNEMLSEILVDWRESGEYEYDGIVVSNDKFWRSTREKNPDHAFAFKMVLSDQVAEAKVVDVLWSPSKDGLLKPVIQIEPIRLKGVDVEFATAYNAKFIEDNKIGIGALVQMVRSGDVIPKILKVIKPSTEPKMPDVSWKWNESHVDAIMEDFESNDVVIMKNMENFFKKLDVVGLGRGNIKRLMDAGFRSIPQILEMKEEDFMEAEGFKEKMASKVFNSVHEKVKSVTLPTLMAATNIFGRGMGQRRIKEILELYPNIMKSRESNKKKIDKIASIHGFKIKTAELFVNYIDYFLKFMHETKLEYKLKISKSSPKKKNTSHVLYDKKIIITGFRDKDLAAIIEEVGGQISSSISKNTFAVIVKNTSETTTKTEKAKKLKIPVMEKNQFVKKYL